MNEKASAVAGFGVATAGTTVGQIDQNLDALRDDVVGAMPLDIDDKANATGVVLMCWRVEALGDGETGAGLGGMLELLTHLR